ncbi:hypothetical protein SAY87_020091 [Trapa incisa]|uniref:Transmembrane protein n=1 Tax=Trapa incisa TaxID=236973 RepID=A0AAN7K0W8_9MYRT|nr:hypothetical protein SAY87_020091 [Trapa incisa]
MASSSSSSFIVKALLVFMVVLAVGSSRVVAARIGPAALMIHQFPMKPEVDDQPCQLHHDQMNPVTSFKYRGSTIFGFFPKGTPVPPAGPSPKSN